MRNRERGWEMSLTHKLVSFLDWPSVKGDISAEIAFSDKEKKELYEFAYKNKVGLFFLQRLKDIGELSPLEDRYAVDMSRYKTTLRIAINVSAAISEYTRDFAIFKFKFFPHTPGDVDILFFLSKKDYLKTVDYLLNNGYFKICECPSQITVGETKNAKDGEYIDLYNEVSASYVIYQDKEPLSEHKIRVDCHGESILALDPIADLPVVITHSVIPEQLFTLSDYYTALYYIQKMDKKGLNKLAQILKESKVTRAGIAFLSITSTVHEKVYGFVPDKITYLMEEIGWDSKTKTEIISTDFDLPYRYSVSTVIMALAERMRNRNGLKSILTQGVGMLDPRMMKWVVWNIIDRRKRETY